MSISHAMRSDGPFSSPNLLQRATPFIGAAVLAMALQPGVELANLSVTRAAAMLLSVFLILSPVWRGQLQRLPRAVHPVPAALALTLAALPIHGAPPGYPAQFVSLAVSMSIPFVMEAVPWGRLPRWGETLALLAAVAPILLSRPGSHAAED